MLNGYSPTFTSFSGGVYEMDLTRTAINNFATHCSKLKPEIEGSALKSLEKTLQHKPNYFMDTTKFIKRLATYVAVEHTAYIIPIEDEYGRLCGWYPLRAERCEVVESEGQLYLRYLFANGSYGAIEFERVGIMTDFEYKGLKSEYGCAPMTGTESMNWYNFVERLAKSGKRLPNYAEFCAYAFGSPAGLDNANTNAWSATSNTGRGVTGSVVNAVSSVGVVDAVGRVWEWLDELITRAEHATNADYHASVAWGWDKKSPLNTGEKSYDVGNIYQYYAYSLAALVAGGGWSDGASCGARAVNCSTYPWYVGTGVGARGACDSL